MESRPASAAKSSVYGVLTWSVCLRRHLSSLRTATANNSCTSRQAAAGLIFLPRELCSRGICHGRVSVCVSVCLSVCLSQVGVLLKWLNVGTRKLRHTIAQGL